VFRGIDYAWASGTNTTQINAYQMPQGFLDLGSGSVLGIPNLTLITLVVLAIAAYALHNFRAGRELYAIGSNPDAARLAGIPTGRRVFSAFVISGGLVGLGGSGTVLGAVLGALLLTTITSALPILGVPAFWQRAVDGAALLVAISLDRAFMVRLAERLRAERAVRRA
jgi:rhamnose transport system permease protein